MFGEFTNKARLSDGNQIKFLAEPLIEYLKMLLETAEVEDLELFTAQVSKLYFPNIDSERPKFDSQCQT